MFICEVYPSVSVIVMYRVVEVEDVGQFIVNYNCVWRRHQILWNADSAEAKCLISRHVGDIHFDRAVRLEMLEVFYGGVGDNVYTIA